MKSSRLMISGALIIFLMIFAALSAPYLSLPDPNAMSLSNQFQPPSSENIFGLDQNGSSVLARVLFGARISLYVAFSVVLISVSIGLIVGSLTGYFGGWIDIVFMRVIDMLYAFPGFLLAIALVAVMGPSVENVIFAMCITGWTGYARLVRGEFLHLRSKDYVVAAQALGATAPRVMIVHIWPNLVGPLVVQATFGMAATILGESALSFLGLGAPPTIPTWGSLLNAGRNHLIEAPHISIFPGLAIVLLVLGFNLFGDGLRDYLDPKKS
jgi:peptide/nickel transport system permease protein